MTESIDPKANFLGVPMTRARNILRAWRHGESQDAFAIAIRKDVDLDPVVVMALLDEFRERGLIGPENHPVTKRGFDGLTKAGQGLVAAQARPRVAKAKAWAAFEHVLDACAKANARDDVPFWVDEVWLFGSMIDDSQPTVGDVDFVCATSLRCEYHEAVRRAAVISKGRGAAAWMDYQVLGYAERLVLYGPKRRPLLAPNDLTTLKALAAPCRKVFDRKEGGRVDGPLLSRHPDSQGRSKEVDAPLQMPDLIARRAPIRPTLATLIEPALFRHWKQLVQIGPWAHGSEEHWRTLRNLDAIKSLSSDQLPAGFAENAVWARMNLRGLDGRRRSGVICAPRDDVPRRPELGVVVTRALAELKSGGVLRAQISVAAPRRNVAYALSVGWTLAIWWAHLILRADHERLVRRAAEAYACGPVKISVGGAPGDVLGADLARKVKMLLKMRGDAAQMNQELDPQTRRRHQVTTR